MTQEDLIQYVNSFYGLSMPPEASHAMAAIVAEALDARSGKGLASPDQVGRLIDLGYEPDLALTLTWAQAREVIRLLTADTVRTEESR